MTRPRILPCHQCARAWIVSSPSNACPACLDDTATDPETLAALDAADPDTLQIRRQNHPESEPDP